MASEGYYRIQGLQQFEIARRRAQIFQLFSRLLHRPSTLLPFPPIHRRLPSPNGLNRGVQEIPVTRIVGSLDRADAFDRLFRPLHDSQRDRWVNMWVVHMQAGWEPILVHQVGNLYFVEDGHHRTSVARVSHLKVIEAHVTEYPLTLRFAPSASLPMILGRLER